MAAIPSKVWYGSRPGRAPPEIYPRLTIPAILAPELTSPSAAARMLTRILAHRGTRRPSAAGPGAALGGERSNGSDEPPGGSGRSARSATRQRWAATYVGTGRSVPVHCGRIISAGLGPEPMGRPQGFRSGTAEPQRVGPGDTSRRARAPRGRPLG